MLPPPRALLDPTPDIAAGPAVKAAVFQFAVFTCPTKELGTENT